MQLFVSCFQKLISDMNEGSFCSAAFLYGHFDELKICYLLLKSQKTVSVIFDKIGNSEVGLLLAGTSG